MFTSKRSRVAALTAASIAAVALAVASPIVASARPGHHHGPAGARDQRTVFYDDFNGTAVDSSKWNIDITQSTQYNNELEAYTASADNVRIVHGRAAAGAHRGALLLQAQYRPGYTTPAGNTLDFTSGKLDTAGKFDTDHGTVSARMKLPAGIGYWPAFWMLGYGNWPDTGEIDVMENIGDPTWVSAATHGPGYSGDAAPVNRGYLPSLRLGDVSAWHTYTVHWTSQAMTFYIDDRMYFNETRPMIEYFGKWAFDNPKYLILNLALGGIYPYKMTGVTTPYYGLSSQTLESIKRGNGRVLVDWVKVTEPPRT